MFNICSNDQIRDAEKIYLKVMTHLRDINKELSKNNKNLQQCVNMGECDLIKKFIRQRIKFQELRQNAINTIWNKEFPLIEFKPHNN